MEYFTEVVFDRSFIKYKSDWLKGFSEWNGMQTGQDLQDKTRHGTGPSSVRLCSKNSITEWVVVALGFFFRLVLGMGWDGIHALIRDALVWLYTCICVVRILL